MSKGQYNTQYFHHFFSFVDRSVHFTSVISLEIYCIERNIWQEPLVIKIFFNRYVANAGESDAKFWYNRYDGILVHCWVLCIIGRSGWICLHAIQLFNVDWKRSCRWPIYFFESLTFSLVAHSFILSFNRSRWISHIFLKTIQIKIHCMEISHGLYQTLNSNHIGSTQNRFVSYAIILLWMFYMSVFCSQMRVFITLISSMQTIANGH